MFIMIWMVTGFAMVVLSSAIKGVPSELLEAARIDGASEITDLLPGHHPVYPRHVDHHHDHDPYHGAESLRYRVRDDERTI